LADNNRVSLECDSDQLRKGRIVATFLKEQNKCEAVIPGGSRRYENVQQDKNCAFCRSGSQHRPSASAATKHHRVTHVHPAIYDTAPAAQSDQIPVLDVNPVCRRIASQSDLEGGLRQTNFEECVKSEQAVRDEIKKEWSTFTRATRPIVLLWLIPGS